MECRHTECRRTFLRAENLKSHEETHNEEKRFQCPHCPDKFRRKSNMARHVSSRHGGGIGPSRKRNAPTAVKELKIYKSKIT